MQWIALRSRANQIYLLDIASRDSSAASHSRLSLALVARARHSRWSLVLGHARSSIALGRELAAAADGGAACPRQLPVAERAAAGRGDADAGYTAVLER